MDNDLLRIRFVITSCDKLSVDIDLTYIPLDDRETALRNISNGLLRIKGNLEKIIPNISVTPTSREGQDVKINCQLPGAQIKVEVNTITRGIIQPTRLMKVKESVENEFDKFAAISVVSHAELFGGKICAALDRQHPRDIFDVRLLLDNEGFTDEVKNGLLLALISHMRPLNEVISPEFIDQRQAFETQFSGMTSHAFSYNDYEKTRKQLVGELHSKLTEKDKMFLLSFKNGNPDWKLFPFNIAEQLPAVLWKLQNIIKLKQENPKKHTLLLKILQKQLFE